MNKSTKRRRPQKRLLKKKHIIYLNICPNLSNESIKKKCVKQIYPLIMIRVQMHSNKNPISNINNISINKNKINYISLNKAIF